MSKARAPIRRADSIVRLIKGKPLGTISALIILILILVAIFADALAPYPYDEIHLIDRLQGPSAQYLLGTDQAGRDLLSRLIFGARVSLLVGLAVTTLSVVISTVIGGTAGFLGGRFDILLQRFVDAWMAFPGLLLLLTMMSIVGRGCAADNTGPGDSRRHRRQASDQRRRNRHQRECVFSGGRRRWLLEIADIHTTRGAECPAYRDHNVQREHWRRNPRFGFSGLPRIWSASWDS